MSTGPILETERNSAIAKTKTMIYIYIHNYYCENNEHTFQ